MGVRFGLSNITCQRYPGDARPTSERYREPLELAEYAEQLGFDSVWCGEHHFVDDGYLPAPLVLCAAIAARTTRITVGAGVAVAPLYDPLRLAEDAAVVSLLSDGRFVLGLAAGWHDGEFAAFGRRFKGRHRYLEDQIEVLRQAWSDGPVTGAGDLAYPAVTVMPKPPGGDVPIWLGGHVEAAVRRAARISDGFVAPRAGEEHPVTLAELDAYVAWIREELATRERDPARFTLTVSLPTLAFEDERVWQRSRDHLWYAIAKHGQIADPGAALPPFPLDRDAAFQERFLLGRPENIVARLRQYEDVAGPDVHFIARMVWPGLDSALLRESMALFAREVIPQLRTDVHH
jgi:alkanesulfonate monooxygenase SsuD/methylene tetrahydromethanopterin reductase-like flavin-dependent oxidoreductase (luciferase family)